MGVDIRKRGKVENAMEFAGRNEEGTRRGRSSFKKSTGGDKTISG